MQIAGGELGVSGEFCRRRRRKNIQLALWQSERRIEESATQQAKSFVIFSALINGSTDCVTQISVQKLCVCVLVV